MPIPNCISPKNSSFGHAKRGPLRLRPHDELHEAYGHGRYARDEPQFHDDLRRSARLLPCGASLPARDARQPWYGGHAPDVVREMIP